MHGKRPINGAQQLIEMQKGQAHLGSRRQHDAIVEVVGARQLLVQRLQLAHRPPELSDLLTRAAQTHNPVRRWL